VGTSKNHRGDKGRTISIIGCSASGGYAPGPDEEEEESLHSHFWSDALPCYYDLH